MVKYFILFNGRTNLDVNLKVESRPSKPSPQKRYEEVDVPGKFINTLSSSFLLLYGYSMAVWNDRANAASSGRGSSGRSRSDPAL